MIVFISLIVILTFGISSNWLLEKNRKIYDAETITKIDTLSNIENKYTSIFLIVTVVIALLLKICKIEYNKVYGLVFGIFFLVIFIFINSILLPKYKSTIPSTYLKKYVIAKTLRAMTLTTIFVIIYIFDIIK